MNKFIALVFLTALIQLSSTFARESTAEILTTKKISKLSYILPLAKISIGTSQTLAILIGQTEDILERDSILEFFLDFFKDLKKHFLSSKKNAFLTVNFNFLLYVTGGFLINSGIQDLKKLNDKNTP